ncbi:IS110 family transposase [Candidatus Dependentiae bacterium]|nr:IS110 family transposase [Candidatus Dependentiae bacterium]
MTTVSKVFIGVDVSKNSLDIYIYPIGKFFKIDNSETAIEQFGSDLSQYYAPEIACEATGGYEKLLAKVLKRFSYHLWVVDPRRIKGFIISSGCKSKTDKIDAQKIAEFAAKNSKDYESINKTENQVILQAWVNRKQDLTLFLVAEKTRRKHPSHELCTSSINKLIKILEKEIKAIDQEMLKLIHNDLELQKKSTILESIPGIGKATAALLISFVPELGQISNKQISAIIGVCPYNRESGNYKGKRFIRGGRMIPRNALYMCSLTTIKYHLPLKIFYDRLRNAKKPFKVAMIAIIHKLIIIANSLLKKGELCRA